MKENNFVNRIPFVQNYLFSSVFYRETLVLSYIDKLVANRNSKFFCLLSQFINKAPDIFFYRINQTDCSNFSLNNFKHYKLIAYYLNILF